MTSHTIGTPPEHLAARLQLLQAEKELTRGGDELARQRRQLPWVRVDKEYVFDIADGRMTLRDVFEGRSPAGGLAGQRVQLRLRRLVSRGPPRRRHQHNFTQDPGGEEHAGMSAFALDDGTVYHTYSCYARGLEAFNTGCQLLDWAPRGRDEDGLPFNIAWLRRRDEYETAS